MVRYKLKATAPETFIFLHAPNGDYDYSAYGSVESVRAMMIKTPDDFAVLELDRCELVEYDKAQAQKLCDDEEGWFCCLDEYVDEI